MTIWDRLHVRLRYWAFLLREFRYPLGIFGLVVLGGGLVMRHAYHRQQVPTYAEACYDVFLQIFMEPQIPFPDQWYLQPLFFLIPIVGLAAIADSVVRLGYLIFARKQQLPEWQRIMAATYDHHIIVIGAGRVGMRIIRNLREMREPVVVVERASDMPHLEQIRREGITLLIGDGRRKHVLLEAGVARARAIILASDDDLTNLDAALTAQELNPKIRVVVRLFDDTLADKVATAFHLPAISTSNVSAPAFIAAATGRKVYQPLELGGRRVYLVDLAIDPQGGLAGRNVGDVQQREGVSIIMYQGPEGVSANPGYDVILHGGDTLLVIAPMDKLLALEESNRSAVRGAR